MPRFTKEFVKALRPDPGGRERFLWDATKGAPVGFGIRIKPSGAASYIVQYRNQEGRTRRMVIGRVGDFKHPDRARGIARDRLGDVRKGGDPSAERNAARKAMTVRGLCALYLDAAEKGLPFGKRGQAKRASTLATGRGHGRPVERHPRRRRHHGRDRGEPGARREAARRRQAPRDPERRRLPGARGRVAGGGGKATTRWPTPSGGRVAAPSRAIPFRPGPFGRSHIVAPQRRKSGSSAQRQAAA